VQDCCECAVLQGMMRGVLVGEGGSPPVLVLRGTRAGSAMWCLSTVMMVVVGGGLYSGSSVCWRGFLLLAGAGDVRATYAAWL
jgi:hypothetical protein